MTTIFTATRIGDVSKHVTVGFVGSMAALFTATGVPLLRGQNVQAGRLDLTNLKFVSRETHLKWKKSALLPGDVVLVRVGYPGTAAVIPDGVGELNAASLVIVRPDPRKVDAQYLCAVLNSPWGKARIAGLLVGSAQQVLNTKTVAEFEVPLPGIASQRRIAGVLSAYDDLIENCERRIRVLDEMARSLYREWFGPGSGVPRGRFCDLATIFRGAIDPRQCPEEEFAHFSLPAFDAGRRAVIEQGRFIQSVKTALPVGCVLLSKLNPRIPRVWMPQWATAHRAIASTEFLVLQGQKGCGASFLYSLCSSPEFLAAFGAMAIGTSTSHQRVKPDSLMQMDVPAPGEAAIREFDAAVTPQLELAEVLRERAANLRATRDLLLPRLLSGQLSVGDAA